MFTNLHRTEIVKFDCRQEYGRTPQYLRRRRHAPSDQKEESPDDFRDMRRVDEDEKQTVLNVRELRFIFSNRRVEFHFRGVCRD